MNRILIGAATAIAALAIVSTAEAQQAPEQIQDYIQQRMPHTWYAQQRDLWKQEVERTPRNADAWLNLYKATRYAGFGDRTVDQPTKYQQMQDLLDSMEKAVPDSYEYHYARWWAGGNRLEFFPNLQRAYELKQDYEDLSDDFISYYELTGDREKRAFFSRQWYATRALSPALLTYNYNVLLSLEPNAIIVTVGDNDTYPLWMLQDALGIRTDVTVMNVSLTSHDEYRPWLMKEEKIKGDTTLLDWSRMSETSYEQIIAEFLKSIAESNTDRPVYFGLTCHPEYLSLIKDDLYIVGLASRYSPRRIDNVAMLKRNWEKFRLDYLTFDIYGDSYHFNNSLLPMLNMNYVAPALLLYEHYRLAGDDQRARHFREFAMTIGRRGGEEESVREYIENVAQEADAKEAEAVPIRNENIDTLLKVYPNPAFNRLTVELREPTLAEIKLVALDGTIIRSGATSERLIEFDIADVKPGVYVLNVTTPRGSASRVVEIQR